MNSEALQPTVQLQEAKELQFAASFKKQQRQKVTVSSKAAMKALLLRLFEPALHKANKSGCGLAAKWKLMASTPRSDGNGGDALKVRLSL